MATQKKIVKAGGAAPDQLEDKVAAELLNLEVRACVLVCCSVQGVTVIWLGLVDGGRGLLVLQACGGEGVEGWVEAGCGAAAWGLNDAGNSWMKPRAEHHPAYM